MLRLIIFTLLFSCASFKQNKVKQQMEEEDISLQSILDLTRSSYLKGCVEGVHHLIKKKTYGNTFEFCRTKAKLHENDIEEILK